MIKSIFAPNGSRIYTAPDIENVSRSLNIASVAGLIERAAEYSAPVGGSSPNGLGFTFGDSFKRTQLGTMDFSIPVGQVPVMEEAFKIACENVFVAKALHLRTIFTCAGLSNDSNAKEANAYFDAVNKSLYLENIYRKAVWLWWTVGLVPILLPDPGQPLTWVEILDPRQVRTFTSFGKTVMNLVPDLRMVQAAICRDSRNPGDQMLRQYWNTIPLKWQTQIVNYVNGHITDPEKMLIELTPGSYIVIENRDMPFNRKLGYFDGSPLQQYFSPCQQYRQLMAGDFAAGFVAKNLIALVSVGDPKTEGDNYQRPTTDVLKGLQGSLSNPNGAQYLFADPTTNIRYITPAPETFGQEKYAEVKEQLKNLLPSCFWANSGTGAFAATSTEMTWLQQEIDHCHDAFDRNFWIPIYQRGAAENGRISSKNVKAPSHHKSNLKDNSQWLKDVSGLYNNGGLSIKTLIAEHGFDPDKEKQNLEDQQDDVKKRIYNPAFESKQGIVANTLGVDKQPAGAANKGSGKQAPGRAKKTGSKPQSEKGVTRTPRPNTAAKG